MDYTSPVIWNKIWSRPYSNYESHHKFFWDEIKKKVIGSILDLGCGSSSCWKGTNFDITGVDISAIAIIESKKNCPQGKFYEGNIENIPLKDKFDTIVLCGVVNYYEDLSKIKSEIIRLSKPSTRIFITINVIDDFPSRHWDGVRIAREFEKLGTFMRVEFFNKIGWLIQIDR